MVQQNYSVLMPAAYSAAQYENSSPTQNNATSSSSSPSPIRSQNINAASIPVTQSNSSALNNNTNNNNNNNNTNINNLFKQLIMPAAPLPNSLSQSPNLQPSSHSHHNHHHNRNQNTPYHQSSLSHQHQSPHQSFMIPYSNHISSPHQQQQLIQLHQQQQQNLNLNSTPNSYPQNSTSTSTSSSSSELAANLAQYTTLSNVNFYNSNSGLSSHNMGFLARNSSLLRGLNSQNGSHENLESFKALKASKILNSDGDNSSKIYGNALLGSNIWDNNEAYQGEKFGPKFEYLEIDEFLNENGLNESDVEFLDQLQKSDVNGNEASKSNNTNSAQRSSLLTLSTSFSTANSISSSSSSSTSPSSSSNSSVSNTMDSRSTSNINMNQNSSSSQVQQTSSSAFSLNSQAVRNSQQTNNCSIVRPNEQPALNFSSISKISSSNSSTNTNKQKESSLNENFISSTSSTGSPRASTNSRLNSFDWSVNEECDDADDLDDMDEYSNSGIRKYDNEDGKLQPSMKKSKKQFVPNELKDEKYWARRRKNNMAAKRSRDARRMKENQIAITASYLERENELLRKQLDDSKRETKLLKAKLARYEAMIPMDGSAK